MSVKHVKEYYKTITEQYTEMQNDLKELEESAQTNLINPENLEQIKLNVEKIKENYQTISWIMYLLNKPNRGEKAKKYNRTYSKKISLLEKHSLDRIVDDNTQSLDTIKTLVEDDK